MPDHVTRVIAALNVPVDQFTDYGELGKATFDLGPVVRLFLYQHVREFSQNRLEDRLRGVAYVYIRLGLPKQLKETHKQRWRFAELDEFLEYFNTERPHQSLKYNNLETPAETYDRLLPTAEDAAALAVADGGEHGTK